MTATPRRPETIRYAVGPCALGLILVASTSAGLCAVFLGDDAEELQSALQWRFAGFELEADSVGVAPLLDTMAALADEPSRPTDTALDLRGTAFQQRVWQALREIPCGETVTYSDLAERLGMPRAVRAVARACGANPVAVLVPCHRVIGRDGSLTGYRWGIERKRQLLERERVATAPTE